SVVGIAAILFTAFLFAKFIGFRNRLMAAFARQGVPYHVANEIYSRAGDFINTMNADGVSPDGIVLEVFRRYPEFFTDL
ncbi:MAG: hypothetical protein WBP18_18590, partial [Paracoccaceae bacterium]